jgi:cytochrome c oxidase subunit 2
MRKYLLIFGIWALAASTLTILHWPTVVLNTSAAVASLSPSSIPTTSAISIAERGKGVFMAKGCVTCHTHAGIGLRTNRPSFGPNLTHYRPDPEFLRRWLRNPQSVRPGTSMPNLNLKQDEIDALIVFLSSSQRR